MSTKSKIITTVDPLTLAALPEGSFYILQILLVAEGYGWMKRYEKDYGDLAVFMVHVV